MNKVLYSSLFIVFLCISFVSASFKEASNTVLDREVSDAIDVINYKLFKAVFFDLNHTVILYVLFVTIFLILLSVMSLIPFFENKISAFFASLIVSLLISITGVYADITNFLFNLVAKFTGGWTLIAFIIVVVILVGFWIAIKEIVFIAKKTSEERKSYQAGFKVVVDNILDSIARRSTGD